MSITPEKITRINELARKSKTPEGLTESEIIEQKTLRTEYIAAFRNSLKAQLDNTVIVEPDGTQHTLKEKAEK